MSAKLQIRLLGGFKLTYEGKRITSIEKSERLQSLLAYLLLNRADPLPRRQIAFIFWPDTTESQARTNLRKLLHLLQKNLPDAAHYLKVEHHVLQWEVASSYQLDVDLLEDALEAAEQDPFAEEAFVDVLRLYKGALLPSAHDDWLSERRQNLQRRIVKVMTNRVAYYEQQASFERATAILERLLLLDPFEEAHYRRLMRLRALTNDYSGAIRTYHTARTMLQDEFEVKPSPQTELLYARIVGGNRFSESSEKERDNEPVTPLVGRRSEWESVQEMYASLQSGDSRCLWISGEAGIGKTRFAEELLAWAYLDGFMVARTRSYGAHGDLAYAPVAQLLRQSELAERVAHLDDVWLSELARILPELLIRRPDLSQSALLPHSHRSVRLYEALCNVVLAEREATVLLFDDLQWCDEETLAWLHYLLRRKHSGRLLVIGTYRDDEVGTDHPLKSISYSLYREEQLADIRLLPLQREEAAQLAEAVSEHALTAAEQRDLFRNTQGNPLFVVEMMRAGLNNIEAGGRYSAVRSAASAELPPRIFSLIQHRLAILSPPAQEIVELAAISGRTFDERLLLGASDVAEATVIDALTELCHKRVVREQKVGVFDFTHDKLRDVVLAQIGYSRKRLLSRRIAETYETLYADRLEDIVGELAVAYKEAGQYRAAVSYYHQAAQAEIKRGAYKRAETYIEEALGLIDDVSEEPAFTEVELTLQLSLANVARVIQRNTIPKARAAFARALELSEALGDHAGRFQALFGLAQYHMTEADLTQAAHFCQRSIAVAEQIDDRASLIRSHLMFGFICLIRGEFLPCTEHMELVASHYNTNLKQPLTTLQGQDTGVMANIYLSFALWILGCPEQSDEKMALAYELARELDLPINLAFVCFYQMLLSQVRHDLRSARRFADRLVKMSEEYDIGFTLIAGRVCQAYVAASADPTNRDLTAAFEQLLNLYHEKVSGLSQPFFLSLKARLFMEAERYEEAQAALTRAVALMDALDDRYTAVETYRLQGELWRITGDGDPEEVFLQAIALAGEQQAKMLQLRAAVSLCRLWQRQAKQGQAHRLLSEIYASFNEGFATGELQEARALVGELAASHRSNGNTANACSAKENEW